jgi:hypothetical protein
MPYKDVIIAPWEERESKKRQVKLVCLISRCALILGKFLNSKSTLIMGGRE